MISTQFFNICSSNWIIYINFPQFCLGETSKKISETTTRYCIYQFDLPYTSSIRVTIPSPCSCLASAAASAACRLFNDLWISPMDPLKRLRIYHGISYHNSENTGFDCNKGEKVYTSATFATHWSN